ncbi:MAG: RNA polymerase sigma factor region1.1 domain-containing protein, partial [Planctomycetota bacterium]
MPKQVQAVKATETPERPEGALTAAQELEKLDAEVKLLIEEGKKKGFLTYEEVNKVLPDDMVAPDKVDQILMTLDELGIDLVDEGDVAEPDFGAEEEATTTEPAEEVAEELEDVGSFARGTSEKIDDPVRMYLTQ